jgi:hypothetical protein
MVGDSTRIWIEPVNTDTVAVAVSADQANLEIPG